MSVLVVIAVAGLVAAAVLVVAWPFVSPDRGEGEPGLTPHQIERIELLERRDALYASLRDLEQEARIGKVDPVEYEDERRRLRSEVAQTLRRLDALDSKHGSEQDETALPREG
jgi:sugar phosphate isomerase/epimerase